MDAELEAKFFKRFAFLCPKDMTREAGHIAIGNGWWRILYDLCVEIENQFKRNPFARKSFQCVQIKEKFAELCFYFQGGDPSIEKEVNEAVTRACRKSRETCEQCGWPGNQWIAPGSVSWIVILCDDCLKKEKERVKAAQAETKRK
jgi:hypothetical protein